MSRRPLRRLLSWLRSRGSRRRREARRLLDDLFLSRPDLLRSTSLRAEHRVRTQVLSVEEQPLRIGFGILRHPRPYAFSRHHHEVLELWCYHVEEERVERVRGVNLSRQRGDDGNPSSFGPGA